MYISSLHNRCKLTCSICVEIPWKVTERFKYIQWTPPSLPLLHFFRRMQRSTVQQTFPHCLGYQKHFGWGWGFSSSITNTYRSNRMGSTHKQPQCRIYSPLSILAVCAWSKTTNIPCNVPLRMKMFRVLKEDHVMGYEARVCDNTHIIHWTFHYSLIIVLPWENRHFITTWK